MNRLVGAMMLSVVAIGAAHAQQGSGGWRGGALFRSADANGDGVVTRDEYQAAVDSRFARMDANGDGVLSPNERPGRGGRMPGGDGASPPSPADRMTRDQYRAQMMRRFDRADTNHDGRIDAAEMQAMMSQYRGNPGGPGNGGGDLTAPASSALAPR